MNKKLNLVENNMRLVVVKNTLSIYNIDDNNNGRVVVNIYNNNMEFSILSDYDIYNHARFMVENNVHSNNRFFGDNLLFNPEINNDIDIHPFSAMEYDNYMSLDRNNKNRAIINLIQFARFNELDIFINNFNIELFTEVKEFLFGDTQGVSIGTFKEILKKMNNDRDKFNQWFNDCTPSWLQVDDFWDCVEYTRDTQKVLLLKSMINTLNEHPYMNNIDNIELWDVKDTDKHMLFGYEKALPCVRYTGDGVYTNDNFDDYMLGLYLSHKNFEYIDLYWSENGSGETLSVWSDDNNPDFIIDNSFYYVEREEAYYHEDEIWWDDDNDEWRLNSDTDESSYIHNYHYSHNGSLYSAKKFKTGTALQVGLEIEVEFDNDNREDIADYIGANFSEDERLFALEEDASLSNMASFEMVTCPFIYDGELPKNLNDALEYLENETNRTFWNCGGHIHIDRNSFKTSSDKLLFIYLFNKFETEVMLLSGRGQDYDNYDYCKFQNPSSIENINLWDNWMEQDDCSYTGRYCAINRNNNSTIEVRVFKGTTSVEIINKRLNLLKNMLAFCDKYTENNVISDDNLYNINKITWEEFSGLTLTETINFNGDYYND